MQTQTALITSRDPKGMQAVSVFEAAYNKAKLDDSHAQRLNEHGDELKKGVSKLIAELSVSDYYADEEESSNYTYPTEYTGPGPIDKQIKAIAEIFNLESTQALEYTKNLPELPEGAEGWFAVPSIDAIARVHFPEATDPGQMYCHAVRLVHEKIAISRSFYNHRDGQIVPTRLRVHARTAHALDLIAENQPGDILVIAAQLGMNHRGRSTRRARECFASNEFGLTSLAVSSIILTHPTRLVRREELSMDCAGDEFDFPVANGRLVRAPCFFFHDNKVMFDASWYGNSNDPYGSASAFVPQS